MVDFIIFIVINIGMLLFATAMIQLTLKSQENFKIVGVTTLILLPMSIMIAQKLNVLDPLNFLGIIISPLILIVMVKKEENKD